MIELSGFSISISSIGTSHTTLGIIEIDLHLLPLCQYLPLDYDIGVVFLLVMLVIDVKIPLCLDEGYHGLARCITFAAYFWNKLH